MANVAWNTIEVVERFCGIPKNKEAQEKVINEIMEDLKGYDPERKDNRIHFTTRRCAFTDMEEYARKYPDLKLIHSWIDEGDEEVSHCVIWEGMKVRELPCTHHDIDGEGTEQIMDDKDLQTYSKLAIEIIRLEAELSDFKKDIADSHTITDIKKIDWIVTRYIKDRAKAIDDLFNSLRFKREYKPAIDPRYEDEEELLF